MTTIKPTRRDRDAVERWGAGDDNLVQSYARHAAAERALERAAIVEWLRAVGDWPRATAQARMLADTIEAGEHISDNAEAIAQRDI